MAALPFEPSDVLDRGLVGLARELAQACLMDQVPLARRDADRADMLEAFDQAKHRPGRGGLRSLPQPGEMDLAGVVPRPGQRIEPAPLFGGESAGQTAMHFPACLVAQLATQPFNGARQRRDDLLLSAGLHDQGGQMRKSI